jgi:pimeloyl-ACP methyl ester carboxylesterase
VRRAAVLAVVVALAGCGGSPRPKVEKVPSLPGSTVVADGHKVYFDCEGKGSPSVVFLNGWGADSESWTTVLRATSRVTRSCTYDRLGTGFTTPFAKLPNHTRDGKDQERELEELLRNARIDPPYVVVGHSWGGALARLYAGPHDDVKAVVLVDSSSPGQDAALGSALPPPRPALRSPEHLAWETSLREAAAVTSFGNRPLVVVTARNDFAGADRVFRVWLALQNRLAALSTDSVHVLAILSGHFVQADQPDVVEAGVRAAVDAVRSGRRLPSCAAVFRHVQYRTCLR